MYRTRFITSAALLLVAAAAACDQPTVPGPQGAQAYVFSNSLVTLEWQEQARALVAANRLSALAAARVYAALSVAQHRAIRSADTVLPADAVLDAQPAAGGRSRYEARRGAIAGASARVLTFLFPAAAATIDQKLAQQADASPGGVHPDFGRGRALGQTQGDAIVTHLQNDGFTRPWTGPVQTGPGKWIPASLPPGGGTLGQMTPYYMTSGAQFRPGPAPAFGSAAFDTDLIEVVNVTQNRTPAQLASALYWDFPAGTPTPIGYWNSAAAGYVAQHTLDERAATEVFSLMHAAVMDALIGCWDAKYHYWVLRPSQASSMVSLAFGVPNFPAYPSGHSCASAAAGSVLTHFFPQHASELANLVNEAGVSRILAGIHFRFDVTAGQQLGQAVAGLAIARGAL